MLKKVILFEIDDTIVRVSDLNEQSIILCEWNGSFYIPVRDADYKFIWAEVTGRSYSSTEKNKKYTTIKEAVHSFCIRDNECKTKKLFIFETYKEMFAHISDHVKEDRR